MTIFSAYVDDVLDNGMDYSAVFITASELGVGEFSGTIHSGMRFINVTVPQGATINSADITTYGEYNSTGTPAARWYAWANDNAGRFSTGGDLPSTVTKTTAFTTFTMSTGDIAHSITSVIQEIINRAGWVSGNAINMIAFDNGSSDPSVQGWLGHNDGSPSLLEIDYTAGGASVGSGLITGLKLNRMSLV